MKNLYFTKSFHLNENDFDTCLYEIVYERTDTTMFTTVKIHSIFFDYEKANKEIMIPIIENIEVYYGSFFKPVQTGTYIDNQYVYNFNTGKIGLIENKNYKKYYNWLQYPEIFIYERDINVIK